MAQILARRGTSLAGRPGLLTVQAVATNLGVAPNSISSRLRRDGTTLELELAKEFLLGLLRPMLPGEDWRSYLRTSSRPRCGKAKCTLGSREPSPSDRARSEPLP